MLRSFILLFALAVGAAAAPAETAQPIQREHRGWFLADVPVWDFADEGLPFRFTLALPSRRDPIARLLLAREARWTFSLGYARVYDSYDAATGIFKNPGGDALLLSVGRQFRWHLPSIAGAFTPRVIVELGGHYATRPFPADGTRANVKLISGLEWTWPTRSRDREWSAAIVWPHFSNANVFERNAGYDGLALRFGRSISF